MTGTYLSSRIFTRLARTENAKGVTLLYFPLFGQELTINATMIISTLRVLANITSGMKLVRMIETDPARIADQSTSRVSPWFSLMSSKEKDFVGKRWITTLADSKLAL